MSSDINVQTFSGKVNITSNLLVGTSHLFVDTINNRVGLVTNTPDAGLHVNSNAYVHTDFRVGSGIVMNDTTGRITAGAFHGDGTNITGINSDSGSWVNGTDVVYLSTIGDKVGIGKTDPLSLLDIKVSSTSPAIRFSDSGQNRYACGIGGVHISGEGQRLDFYVGDSGSNTTNLDSGDLRMSIKHNGNVGIGTTSPLEACDIHGVSRISAAYPRLDFYTTTRTGSDTWGNSTNAAGDYRIYANGDASDGTKRSLNFDYGQNSVHTSRMVINAAGNVGIGTTSPDGTLHVKADNRVHITTGTVPVFTGLSATASDNGRAQFVLNSSYSDLVIASSFVNNSHGSTLSFAAVNPSNTAEYRKFVINQGNWGSRKDFLEFGLSASTSDANPHLSINSTDTVLTLDGNNKRVGIGTTSPQSPLHVAGSTDAAANTSKALGIHMGVYQGAYAHMEIVCGSSNSGWIDFKNANTSGDGDFEERIRGGDGNLVFHTNKSERMRINTSGNVGIGTTGPGAKLDVNGTFHAKNHGWRITGSGGNATYSAGQRFFRSNYSPYGSSVSVYNGASSGQWSHSNGYFTFPTSGLYMITLHMFVNGTATGRYSRVDFKRSNGVSNISQYMYFPESLANNQKSWSTMYIANAGDFFYMYPEAGTITLYLALTHTVLEVYKIW